MEGKGRNARERGGKGRKKEKRGSEGEGRKIRTHPPSISAYAPGNHKYQD